MDRADIDVQDSYFLSKTNPTATVDQRDLERLALELLDSPVITNAKARATAKWKLLHGDNFAPEADQYLAADMREWAFHYLLLGLNADPNYPKVLSHIYGPPHQWFGMTVPGTRGPGTGENPDNNYAFVPIDGQARFELHGTRMDPPIRECPFQLLGNLEATMDMGQLNWDDVVIDPDGSFVITVGPEPGGGRPNHLQSMPSVRYLFIRDGRVDWRDVPNAYRIQRLDPPTAAPLPAERLAELGSKFIIDAIGETFFNNRLICSGAPNTVSDPLTSGSYGGLAVQKVSFGHLLVADDEAFVLHVGPGGSQYWGLTFYDYWLQSQNFWDKTSSLNNSQSEPNQDGSYTFVLCAEDPGVHNWIDTLGLREAFFMLRWTQLPRQSVGTEQDQWIRGERTKLKDLESRLPAGTKWVTPVEREAQLRDRRAAFDLRYTV